MAERGGVNAVKLDRIDAEIPHREDFQRRLAFQDLHRSCTFANYEVAGRAAKSVHDGKSYAQNFGGEVDLQALCSAVVREPGKTILRRQSEIIAGRRSPAFWW